MPASRSAIEIASPMPRVPPVTTATRAMILSFSLVVGALWPGRPSFKLASDDAAQHCEPRLAVVEAGKVGEIGAAGAEEGIAAADRQLLQRLEAIGREAGRHDRDLAQPPAGKAFEHLVRRGLEPFGAAEAGLEGENELAAHRVREQPGRLVAVAIIRIAELQRPLRHAVETCQHRLRLENA